MRKTAATSEKEILRKAAALGPMALLYAKMDESWMDRLVRATAKAARRHRAEQRETKK